jgi:hypothetical protein
MQQDFNFEKSFWGTCQNTFDEESKQIVYAKYMELNVDEHTVIRGVEGKRILDIGGGPSSMLLKTSKPSRAKVIDPLKYPTWVYHRYDEANIEWEIQYGEEIKEPDNSFDEVWIYNVLQHVTSPELIIQNAKRIAPKIRMFEWINIPAYPGHPQELTKERLDKALGVNGKTSVWKNTYCYYVCHCQFDKIVFPRFKN